jgi:ArsR family transcriptional regulator
MNRLATHPDQLMSWMTSLADPARVRLLRLMEQHELGVSDLCSILQMPQSTVSRHLKILSEDGWVSSRRQATSHLYQLMLDELAPPQRDLWVLARSGLKDWAAFDQDDLRLAARLAEKQSDSKVFFAGAADQWDRVRSELYGETWRNSLLLNLLPSDAVIADLGCGTASLVADIAPHVKQVIGVDNSKDMLKAGRQRTRKLGNVELREGELDDLPVADNSCDYVLFVLVWTYIDRVEHVIAEAKRVLKPGGRLIAIDLLEHDREAYRREMGQRHNGFSLPRIESLLKTARFNTAATRPLPPAAEAKGPALFIASACKQNDPS